MRSLNYSMREAPLHGIKYVLVKVLYICAYRYLSVNDRIPILVLFSFDFRGRKNQALTGMNLLCCISYLFKFFIVCPLLFIYWIVKWVSIKHTYTNRQQNYLSINLISCYLLLLQSLRTATDDRQYICIILLLILNRFPIVYNRF